MRFIVPAALLAALATISKAAPVLPAAGAVAARDAALDKLAARYDGDTEDELKKSKRYDGDTEDEIAWDEFTHPACKEKRYDGDTEDEIAWEGTTRILCQSKPRTE